MTNIESVNLIKKQLESKPDDLVNTFDQKNFSDELKALEQIWYSKFKEVPFGNSLYQEINFVIGSSLTPGRAYRQIGLKIQELLVNLQEAWYKCRLGQLQIEKMKKKIGQTDDEIDRKIIALKIEKKSSENLIHKKLLRDAIVSLQFMYSVLDIFPEYSGEKFEAEEAAHFQISLDRQLNNVVGAIEARQNMFVDADLLLQNVDTPLNILQDHINRLARNTMAQIQSPV